MPLYKLANVILSGLPQLVKEPLLCCRTDRQVLGSPDDAMAARLVGPGSFDFTTYFNGLPVLKWRRYTVARTFWLHLELRGAACTVTQTRTRAFSWDDERVEATSVRAEASESWQAVDLKLSLTDYDVIDGFVIDAEGSVELRDAYYTAEVEESQIRPVELALCITTFKKESYVTRNIDLLRRYVLGSDEPIASHFHVHVADNGRTLDADGLSGGGISIWPNDNVGGAGGFARGMIEAMRWEVPATHVIMMDDDVSVSPESFVRTYNLLALVNDEYAEGFLGGAMLDIDEPSRFVEDSGYMTEEGLCESPKLGIRLQGLRVSALHTCTLAESSEPNPADKYQMNQRYCAWWYCCIPVATIKREGLPLPLFVRFDDAEYGMRCKPKIMNMNGICVWHEAFERRYSATSERYQAVRNGLIIQATTGAAPLTDFAKTVLLFFRLELTKYNYDDAELVLQGFEDFLAGPERVFARGFAEKAFMASNKNREHLLPLDEAQAQCDALGIDIDLAGLTPAELARNPERNGLTRMYDLYSYNSQRFGSAERGKNAMMPAAGWEYYMGSVRRSEHIVAVDVDGAHAIVRSRDLTRFRELTKRYDEDMRLFHREKKRIYAEYASWRERVTSEAFWLDYLGIE